MDSLKVVFYGGVGLVAVLGLIMTIGVLMSDTVETPPPVKHGQSTLYTSA